MAKDNLDIFASSVQSGIYAIIGLRWQTHYNLPLAGKHHARPLQNAWNKYGSSAFSFVVLEEMDVSRESAPLYNIAPCAGSNRGMRWKLSDEQIVAKKALIASKPKVPMSEDRRRSISFVKARKYRTLTGLL